MSEQALLEPSFADAIAAIEQAEALPQSKRTHWSCSLRKVAKALDRPPESIAARWLAVALQINQLHHANSGVAWKTLANHKANAKAALFWFRNEQGLPGRGTPLDPKWKSLRRRLKDRSRLAKLSGVIRYCSLKGIKPGEVDEAVVDGYMAYRKETTALAVDNKGTAGNCTSLERQPHHRRLAATETYRTAAQTKRRTELGGLSKAIAR